MPTLASISLNSGSSGECISLARLCNAFVGQAFQPDRDTPDSLNLGDVRRPRKADLRMRCKAHWRGWERLLPSPRPERWRTCNKVIGGGEEMGVRGLHGLFN